METRWLTTALAALAVTTAPLAARADEAKETAPAPAPEATQAQASETPAAGPTVSAPAPTVLAQNQTPPTPPNTTPAPEKQPGSGENAPAAPAPKFTYGASADFYFANNFNDPFNKKNQLRAFDIEDDGSHPHLGLIDLWAQYARDPIGGRIDIDFGPTARLVNAFDPSHSDVWQHIQQAYISVNLDGKKGKTYLDAGKWVTTVGAEVIEPKDNWLYSRGLLFNWVEPFYHLGVRGYHYFNDTDYVVAAVQRGWNSVGDPNHDPGFILGGSKALSKKLQVTANYVGGEEVLATGKDYRSLLDVVLAYTQSDKLSHSLNIDYVQQSNAIAYGASFMTKYALDKKSYLAGRVEWLHDDKGAYLPAAADAYSFTVDYQRVLNKYLQARLEFREDFNGGPNLFLGNKPGKTTDSQPTILFSVIASYN